MAKINLAITVDNHVNTWLNEQPTKRSTLINKILNEYIQKKSQDLPTVRKSEPNLMIDRGGNIMEVGPLDIQREILLTNMGFKMYKYAGDDDYLDVKFEVSKKGDEE